MLTCVTLFRNASPYLDETIAQFSELHEWRELRLIAAEGDSTDDTAKHVRARLGSESFDHTVLTVEHGGPPFGSVDFPLRWRQIASVGNVALAAAVRESKTDDPILYVESDLRWDVADMLGLLDDLARVPAVAPLSLWEPDGRFYDTWGYVKDGVRFEAQPPYFLPEPPEGDLVEIDSSGSCFAVAGVALPTLQFSPVDCIRGIGRSLRDAGFGLWLDSRYKVVHP